MEVDKLLKGTFLYSLDNRISYRALLKIALFSPLAGNDKKSVKQKCFRVKYHVSSTEQKNPKPLYRDIIIES